MKIAMTGATGFIGSHIRGALVHDGHQVVVLGRADFRSDALRLSQLLEGCDVIINLAGEPISKRWTEAYKKRIALSRLTTTRKLVEAVECLDKPPHTFISTSAIGAFDSNGTYTEDDSPNGTDFLASLSTLWEAAAFDTSSLEMRTVIFRFGLVLGQDGGLIKQLLTPFKLGLGGKIGDGQQHFSWIHIDDVIKAYRHVLYEPKMRGVYHLCSPKPATNEVFTRLLGDAVDRPTLLPVPKALLKLLYGEGAEVMTSGQSVVSTRLPRSGFVFSHPDLGQALSNIIARPKSQQSFFKLASGGQAVETR